MNISLIKGAIKESSVLDKICNDKKFEARRIEAEIIRNVHSIEKGLCIENPRFGFGRAKIELMIELTEKYLSLNGDTFISEYVIDVINTYLEYHNSRGYTLENLNTLISAVEKLECKIQRKNSFCGGFITISKNDSLFDVASVEKMFISRHSVRDFTNTPVSDEIIEKAIQLAQRAPSACNRQAVRIYNISPKKYVQQIGSLDGIGGFADSVDRFLLITGVQSAYRASEKNQYIVSAAFFASYLTLALHTYGIGVCTVQRSLYPDKVFREFRSLNSIPEDEQIVVMLGIGNLKERYNVPISKRFPVEKIYRKLD